MILRLIYRFSTIVHIKLNYHAEMCTSNSELKINAALVRMHERLHFHFNMGKTLGAEVGDSSHMT